MDEDIFAEWLLLLIDSLFYQVIEWSRANVLENNNNRQ